MRYVIATIALLMTLQAAHAGCELALGPCSSDSQGNRYTTEENLGGGYTTYRNGSHYSNTDQTLGGTWREQYDDGSSRSYNYDPYGDDQRR